MRIRRNTGLVILLLSPKKQKVVTDARGEIDKTEFNHNPSWFIRAIRGERRFWRQHDDRAAFELREPDSLGIGMGKGMNQF